MKKFYIITAILLSSISYSAQSDVSAWTFSSTEFSGTSRYNAMAGAFGALGGDVSVLGHNPAGIGLFRRSEFSFTPAFQLNEVSSNYLGTTSEDIKANANINNIAFVSSKTLNDDNWKNVQFGISYNRLKDFHNNTSVIGTTDGTTYADQLAAAAQGFSSSNFEQIDPVFLYPAWQTYVFDPADSDFNYVSGFYGDEVKQIMNRESSGRIGETTVSMGANYNDKLYLGGAIGFQRIKTSQESSYTESAEYELQDGELADYTVTETLNTVGSGIGLKLGAIYRVNNIIRTGLAYHSPSFMTLTADQSTRFVSNYSDGELRSERSDTRISEYNLSSPSKVIGSVAFVIGKTGLIDVDYEYADYSKMKLRPGGASAADFSDDNQDITNNFKATNNVRVGGEWRVQPFSLRAGIAYYDNPNSSTTDAFVAERTIYSFGAGYKRNGMYLDFAYRIRTADANTYLYSPDFAEVVNQSSTGNSLSITCGVRF